MKLHSPRLIYLAASVMVSSGRKMRRFRKEATPWSQCLNKYTEHRIIFLFVLEFRFRKIAMVRILEIEYLLLHSKKLIIESWRKRNVYYVAVVTIYSICAVYLVFLKNMTWISTYYRTARKLVLNFKIFE